MIQLFSEGAYLVDGTTLVKESEAGALKHTILPEIWRNFRLNSIN